MYGKDDVVPRIGDAIFTVGYGLGTGQQAGEMDLVEE